MVKVDGVVFGVVSGKTTPMGMPLFIDVADDFGVVRDFLMWKVKCERYAFGLQKVCFWKVKG